MMGTAVFYLVAVVGVVSAIAAVSHKNPVVNVLSLVVTLFCIAVSYALLGAEFLAAAQILVYAGAILVLFLFVVMLLGAPEEPPAGERRPFQRAAGLALAGITAAGGVAVLAGIRAAGPAGAAQGTADALGRLLTGPYLFAFEFISVLLLAAMVGALMLVKRKH
ncbi:MAG: NADH-quinone oxidoreductase subunit J [Thermoanaerobaculaceae bacterium]|nr:NADH-quinone oxidoreductase subunit J [Thermoanaerobaculaceae bacterium]TAM44981.1 MAG: NADH-quinone oxidoreductase subunit J [Acidobacteriota bacterium]